MNTPELTEAENLESQNATMRINAKKVSNYNLFATALSGCIVGAALIILAYMVGPYRDVYPTTYLICICGYTLGWIVAIVSTPMNKTDESKIERFTKMAGMFLTGYLLSKFDKLLQTMLEPTLVFTSISGVRLLLFICCFGLTFIMVFYFREYKWSVKEAS